MTYEHEHACGCEHEHEDESVHEHEHAHHHEHEAHEHHHHDHEHEHEHEHTQVVDLGWASAELEAQTLIPKMLKQLETEINNAIEGVKTKNDKVSLMMIDIDYFKAVNDKFGHSVGDVVLKQFVDYVVDFLKPYNTVTSRWGGEEFLCVCYKMDIEQTRQLAEKLRVSISEAPFDNIYNLTCSIGLTEISPADTEKSAFDRADKAMYDAKTNGRNCVVAN